MQTIHHLIAAAALAFAGTAAQADDIAIVKDNLTTHKSRAEVRAETLQAQARGELPHVGEMDSSAPVPRPVTGPQLTRDQVRAELRNAPKNRVMQFNPAA